MTEELNPCPFCGECSDFTTILHEQDHAQIRCEKCFSCGPIKDQIGDWRRPHTAWNTRAEPAPLPDEVETAIYELELSYPETGGHNILGGEHYANKIRTRIAALAKELEATKQTAAGHYLTWQCTEAGLREKIAALEAENKRLRDECRWAEGALRNAMELLEECKCNRAANQKNAAYVTLHHFLNRIKSALAQPVVDHKTPEVSYKVVCGSHVSDKQPEPQKCGTCGGRGWEYSPMENTKVDCMNCNGTGKAG